MGCGDGAVQGREDRHVPPILGELHRPFRLERHRLRRAEAGDSADTGPYGGAHQEKCGRSRVKITLVEPYFDVKTPEAIARETGGVVLVLPPSVSGVPQVKDYIGLFDYDVAQLVAAFKKVGVSR